jgi:pimeloyl-ACP methyl ester carboxylesterase
MSKSIVFVHGMFLNPKSWERWRAFFSEKGYNCSAPAWPHHEGDPARLRNNPPAGLGGLHLQAAEDAIARAAAAHDEPILIGHSLGGLIVQRLINRGVGSLGIAMCSVAPNKMLSLDWGFFKNSLAITNPLAGNEPYLLDATTFHENFGNAMSRSQSDALYYEYAMHEIRNVLRDIRYDAGRVDVERAHAPLLFVAADKDHVIPPELVGKNARAYSDGASIVDYEVFKNRGHFIYGQPDWMEVAQYIHGWIGEQAARASWRTSLPRADIESALHAPALA